MNKAKTISLKDSRTKVGSIGKALRKAKHEISLYRNALKAIRDNKCKMCNCHTIALNALKDLKK